MELEWFCPVPLCIALEQNHISRGTNTKSMAIKRVEKLFLNFNQVNFHK